jgi:hypothetical protein
MASEHPSATESPVTATLEERSSSRGAAAVAAEHAARRRVRGKRLSSEQALRWGRKGSSA